MKTQPATGETYPKSDLFNKAPHCRKISVRQYYQKRVIFYPTTLQRTACKKCLFLMRDIIISS
ncbi:hypothetical protein F9X64_13585 [Escherichia coli]|nr:hypothetical protein [Escherichia coli]